MAAAETVSGTRGVQGARFELSERGFAYLLNLPAIMTVLLLVGYPIVDAFWLSLHRFNLRRPDAYAFVGLQNYLDVLTSDQFLPSLSVTLVFTFWSTFGVLFLALGMALVANEAIPQRAILRALILLPWAMSAVRQMSGIRCRFRRWCCSLDCRQFPASCTTPPRSTAHHCGHVSDMSPCRGFHNRS